MIFTGITQGILLAGGSVYVNQVIKQRVVSSIFRKLVCSLRHE